jgi:acyl-coenzyme A synthetase/AMP-(fatty) acid ligase/acyl carrier protein
MAQSPPLHVEGETLTGAFLRGCRQHPERVFLDDRSSGVVVTWGESAAILSSVMRQWDSGHVGTQLILRGDGSWRTIIAYLAAHLSGRLLVCGDVSNPVTHSGKPLDRAVLDVISLDDISTDVVADGRVLDEDMCHRWNDGDVGRIFRTSGSTGEPKLLGVYAENRFSSDSPLFERGTSLDHYSVLNVRRPSTVVFNANVRRTVRSGGTMYMVDISRHDFRDLDSLLGSAAIAEMNLTPTMLLQMSAVARGAWTTSVESVNLSGERVTHECLVHTRELFPHALIRNNYGMTEGSASFAALVLEPGADLPSDPVPAGTVNPKLNVLVLAEDGVEMPPGQSGRVVVGGLPPVPEAFVDDTGRLGLRELHPADRLETGDLGRFTMEGLLVVEGRVEQMVKIRGERVSLLDVERAVVETGLVAEVLAAVYSDAKGGTAIGAVVVAEEEPNLGEIRRMIASLNRLVLCPTRIVAAPAVPVLPTGKVDRGTASKMLSERGDEARTEVYSAAEMSLCHIVADVLALDFVAREEDIFSLGADSLSSLQILHDMEDVFGRRFDVGFLLENPTIIEMAAALSSRLELRSRVMHLAGPRTGASVYWILPGANPYMARPIAAATPAIRHAALLNLGALPDDVVLCDYDEMVRVLVRAIESDAARAGENFVIAGFSSGCYLANAAAAELGESGHGCTGLVLVDPPAHADIVAEWCDSGKITNPINIVHGREGAIALLDPVAADRALFGLQLFALARHHPPCVAVPRLFIGSGKDRFTEPQWLRSDRDTVVVAEQAHLDFVRRPETVASALQEWGAWRSLAGVQV